MVIHAKRIKPGLLLSAHRMSAPVHFCQVLSPFVILSLPERVHDFGLEAFFLKTMWSKRAAATGFKGFLLFS